MTCIRWNPARYCAASALACVAALAAAAAPAQASGVLNSECSPPGGSGFAIISFGGLWAQTFKANSDGELLKVDVKALARQGGGTGGDVNVQLYGTDSSGTPVTPVLATTTIPGASVNADNFFHDYSAEFAPSTAAYLTAGSTYAIALSTADSKQDSWSFKEGNPCAGVGLFLGPGGHPPFAVPMEGEGWDAGINTYLSPPNDNFEHAELLSGQGPIVEGTTAGASRQEPAEPDHYTTDPPDSNLWVGDHSVWYRWTAPNSGLTTIDTCSGQIDSILAVYTGTQLSSLTRVTDNNNDPACTSDIYGSKVSFEAVAGTTYDIVVGDAGGAREQPFTLAITGAPDTTPPDTQIVSGPSGPTVGGSPSFTFSSEPGATFQCRLDSTEDTAFQACASPKAYSSLASGDHKFEVRAIDEAGNRDPTPASRTFTIEAVKHETELPDSVIRRVKVNRAKHNATVSFSSTEPDATFLCKLDRKPFKACKSPKTYRHLKPGRHHFQVEARDSSGDLDPTPAARQFKVKQ